MKNSQCAALTHNAAICKLLIHKGADPNVLDFHNVYVLNRDLWASQIRFTMSLTVRSLLARHFTWLSHAHLAHSNSPEDGRNSQVPLAAAMSLESCATSLEPPALIQPWRQPKAKTASICFVRGRSAGRHIFSSGCFEPPNMIPTQITGVPMD